MAMVGNSAATQSGNRNWSSVPSSSSPAGADESLSHPNTAQANLHGVIGEHRRSSRSSSVSSGGSSGNNTDSHDPSRSMQQNRLQPSSSQPDQNSMHLLPQIEDASGKEHNVFSTSSSQIQNGSLQSTSSSPSTELVSQIGVMPNGSDPMSMGYGMASRALMASPGFSQQPNGVARQGRPITGTYSGAHSVGNEPDYSRLMNDGGLATGFPSGQMNFGGPHHDVFSMASMEASLMNSPSPNSMMAGAGAFPSTQKPFSGGSGAMPYSSGQYFYPQGGSNNHYSNGPQSASNSFYNNVKPSMSNGHQQQLSPYGAAAAAAPSYYQNPVGVPNGRAQNGGSAYLYNAAQQQQQQQHQQQDFTMPPPWQGYGLSGEVINKVTCNLCHQLFKWPHALDCLHVFCFTCLVKHFDISNKVIICKKCNFATTSANGVCGLRLDYQLCNFMLKNSLQPLTCTLCTREELASWCCEMCSAFLCNDCCERHKDMLHFNNHEVKRITKATIHNGEVKPMCKTHPEEPEVKYCVSCEVMICETCIPDHTHASNPNSNQNYDLQEAYNIVAPRLQTWNEDAFIKYQDVLDIIKRFPDLQSLMDMRKRHAKRMVEDYADYIKTVVDQSRAAAIDQLDQGHSQMESKINGMVKQYSDLCTGYEGMHAFNRRTLDEGSIYDVMKNLDKMENRYKMIIALHAEVLKCPDGISVDFKFSPNYPGTNELIHENFQMLTYKVNDIEYPISPAPTPNKLDPKSGRKFLDYNNGSSDNPDCNYQRWSSATESVSISTWNSGSERDRKNGTFIPNINRCRTRTSYIHVFGEYGRGDYAFTEPSGQAYLKDGSYVICDTNNHRIVYYNAKHEFVRSIGMPDNLPPLEEQDQRGNGLRNKGFTRQENCLYFPNRVAICPITQNIVATERPPSHDIQIFTKEGEFKNCFGGNILQHPRGVTVDENGIIIVVECKVMKLVMFDQEGNFIVSHSLTKDLEFPNDVAAKEQRIYISDNRGHCVQVYNYDAEFIMKIGFESVTYFPIGVSINFQNQLVVTDNHNTFNITVFDLSGKVLHIFESITKHAQCHNVAVHPSSLELMLTTKDCNVYFFNYDPNAQHPPPAAATRHSSLPFNSRRNRGNGSANGGSNGGYY